MNETIGKFGYPATLIREYDHWMVLVRPAQPTLGSLVLAAKSDATAFSALAPAAFAELSSVIGHIEAALKAATGYQRINYLMLMMVDPHVHFHVLPRYEGTREGAGLTIPDTGWPGTPDLNSVHKLNGEETDRLARWLKGHWA
jgi:diadenosine tetraphosphate (Ap4A) HIT family hydrolase